MKTCINFSDLCLLPQLFDTGCTGACANVVLLLSAPSCPNLDLILPLETVEVN